MTKEEYGQTVKTATKEHGERKKADETMTTEKRPDNVTSRTRFKAIQCKSAKKKPDRAVTECTQRANKRGSAHRNH